MTLPNLLDVERAIYKRSYYEFFKAAFPVLHAGEKYKDNWHVAEFCNLLQAEFERVASDIPREKNIVLNTPFRSAKSLIFSVVFQAWAWSVRPESKFICVSFSESLAFELAGLSRDLIQSEWYQQRWGNTWKFKSEKISHLKTNKGGFRKSVGTGGQITGSGAEFIILDDPQDPQMGASAVERASTIAYYTGTLYSRISKLDIGARMIVQQRLHDEDLTGYLLKNNADQYTHYCVPAELNANLSPKAWEKYYTDGLFWPGRFSRAVLLDYLKTMGSTGYANQLLQKASPEEGGLLKKHWFQTCTWADFMLLTRSTTPVWEFDFDTAYTAKAQNDPSAYLVSTLVENVLYIRSAGEVRLEAPQLLRFISELAEKQGYTPASRLFIEPKASGPTILQLIRDSTQLNVVAAPAPATDKVTRVSAAAPFVESLRVVLIEGPWHEAFVAQCTGFPNAPHDDMVDCLTQRIARAQAPAKKQRAMSF